MFFSLESQKMEVSADAIEILDTPDQFYETLIKLTRQAQRRITLASLYLGNNPKDHALVLIFTALKSNSKFL